MKIPWRLIGCGVAVYGAGVLGSLAYFSQNSQNSPNPSHGDGCGEGCRFDHCASKYDDCIGLDETMMGINLIRWYLFKNIKGDVLEISAGTGRNLPYYNIAELSSLTLVDVSKPMLTIAEEKYKKIAYDTEGAYRVKSKFVNEDAGLLKDSNDDLVSKFDVIVDTFGLCSHGDPVAVLKRASALCKSPESEIILLEHGQGHYKWINNLLNDSASEHFDKWGCWWNRDIIDIVNKADLHIESCWRWHFGTTYIIRARPKEKR